MSVSVPVVVYVAVLVSGISFAVMQESVLISAVVSERVIEAVKEFLISCGNSESNSETAYSLFPSLFYSPLNSTLLYSLQSLLFLFALSSPVLFLLLLLFTINQILQIPLYNTIMHLQLHPCNCLYCDFKHETLCW